MDPLRGASEKIGTIQRRLAWPLRKDDTHTSRMYHFLTKTCSACLYPRVGVATLRLWVHTWMGASSDHQDSSPSGKLLPCTPELNEPLRGSPSGLPTFSFLSEKCGVRAHFYTVHIMYNIVFLWCGKSCWCSSVHENKVLMDVLSMLEAVSIHLTAT